MCACARLLSKAFCARAQYGPEGGFEEGDVVCIEVDMRAGTLEMFVNEKSHGIVLRDFSGVRGVAPAVALFESGDSVEFVGLKVRVRVCVCAWGRGAAWC